MTLQSVPSLAGSTCAPSRSRRRTRPSWLLPLVAGDSLVVSAAALTAPVGRGAGWLTSRATEVARDPRLVAPLVLAGWMTVIAAVGGYRADVQGAGTDEYSRIARGTLYAGVAVGLACYLADYELSRGLFLLLFGLGLPGLLASHLIVRKTLHSARRRGQYGLRMLICFDDIADALRRDTWLGYHVIGAVLPTATQDETTRVVPILGEVATDAEPSRRP